MSRSLLIAALLAAPAIAAADPTDHAVGTWVELMVDSSLTYLSSGAPVIDVPTQHLVLGGQLRSFAIGVELGMLHIPDSATGTEVDVGPTARVRLAATSDRTLELVAEGGLLAQILVATNNTQGGPTTYTFDAGVTARYWIDRHFALGAGAIAHIATVSSGGTSATDVGVAGALRVTGVF